MIARVACLMAALSLAGCPEPPPPTAADASASASAPSATVSSTTEGDPWAGIGDPLAPDPPEPPPVEAGPKGSAEALGVRQTAVLELLAGGEPATRLPLRATDRDKEFRPSLRQSVSPRVQQARVRMERLDSTPGLPPEVIQRIVRQNFGRFRLCYQRGLERRPDLSGRVTVKFSIDRSGKVVSSSDGGSTLPDKQVVTCMVQSFNALSFPEPLDGKTVSVTFPIELSP